MLACVTTSIHPKIKVGGREREREREREIEIADGINNVDIMIER